ncbi:phage tail assembly protein [Sphingobium sp. SCG-1]|nr:phage tail assembly protein [Sphingobium sp. SCG-1]
MTHEVTLCEPIVRGETSIDKLTLRKPKSGELRGLSLAELQNANVTAVLNLLPRITQPLITQQEADALEPEDLSSCCGAVIDFLLTSEQRVMVAELLKG